MGKDWFYSVDGQVRKGPVPEQELKRLLASNQIPASTLVWSEGMTNWVSASSIALMTPTITRSKVPTAIQSKQQVPATVKIKLPSPANPPIVVPGRTQESSGSDVSKPSAAATQDVRAHIIQVLQNDKDIWADRKPLSSVLQSHTDLAQRLNEFLEYFSNMYGCVEKCLAINLLNCPVDFSLAYREHIYAWKQLASDGIRIIKLRMIDDNAAGEAISLTMKEFTGSYPSITDSWQQVMQAALCHGVQWG